jgi:HEAT repeat protein
MAIKTFLIVFPVLSLVFTDVSSTAPLSWSSGTSVVSAQTLQVKEPSPAPARAGAMAFKEAVALAEGWALLAQGRVPQAGVKAAEVLAMSPRSVPALTLAIEVDIARAGAVAGLVRYERWIGQRNLEEPSVLRRIAYVALREEASQKQDPTSRLQALRALADEGDPGAIQELSTVASSGAASTELRTLAALGDQRAVQLLLAQLKKGIVDVRTIDALGTSGSPLAAGPLALLLDDQRMEVRGAAAEALGKIDDPGATSRLKALLTDRSVHVRVKAAGALMRKGDVSGLPMLQELMADQSPETRIAAAEAMSVSPDATWLAGVRELTQAIDPAIRASAARLVAAHDPELARSVLEPLASHENPAIRELAALAGGDALPDDLTKLRPFLKSNHRLTRVRAATRVLLMTR